MHSNGSLTKILDRNVTIVLFGAELKQIDELNVADLGERLLQMAEQLPQPLLVLDLGSTEFFGSSFIEVLFRVWKRMTSKPGAHLGISAMQPYCREVLHVTHLDTLWQIYDTYQAASDDFNKTVSTS